MYSNLVKVKGETNLVRDNNSGAILNVNHSELENARKHKALRRQQNEDINNLKTEVSDIKKMLTQIIEKLDG